MGMRTARSTVLHLPLAPQSRLLWLALAVSLQAATWKLWCGGHLSLVPHLPLPAVVTCHTPFALCILEEIQDVRFF